MVVLGISGSLRPGSYNRRLLQTAAGHVPSGFDFEILEGLEALPPYDEELDNDQGHRSARWLRNSIAAADAVLIATPEYNASVPGGLKNVLDWASRPFPDNCLRGKPTAVVGASTGLFGAVWAQAELRKVLRAIGAQVVETGLSVPSAHTAFTADGRLRDPTLAAALGGIVDDLLGRVTAQAA